MSDHAHYALITLLILSVTVNTILPKDSSWFKTKTTFFEGLQTQSCTNCLLINRSKLLTSCMVRKVNYTLWKHDFIPFLLQPWLLWSQNFDINTYTLWVHETTKIFRKYFFHEEMSIMLEAVTLRLVKIKANFRQSFDIKRNYYHLEMTYWHFRLITYNYSSITFLSGT